MNSIHHSTCKRSTRFKSVQPRSRQDTCHDSARQHTPSSLFNLLSLYHLTFTLHPILNSHKNAHHNSLRLPFKFLPSWTLTRRSISKSLWEMWSMRSDCTRKAGFSHTTTASISGIVSHIAPVRLYFTSKPLKEHSR